MTFVDVKKDPMHLARMLQHSGGMRTVPVIVDHGAVTIGYGGT